MIGPDDILSYWFGDSADMSDARFELWFGKDPEVDREIRDRFGAALEEAGRGEFDSWKDSARSCLALIVLLDQFPRNVHRNDARSFAFDRKAREVAIEGIERGFDQGLSLYARLFFYLPLEHSEEMNLQERSVELYGKLLADAPAELKQSFEMVYNYALRHREIIARFGRFPHRNQVLGRASTDEELEFLKGPDSSF